MTNFDYGSKLPDGQHERHPSLPPEQRRDFVRPVRESYRHVGKRPKHPTRPLTEEEQRIYAREGYECFEPEPPNGRPGFVGRFWTAKQLASGCGTVTKMGRALAETYAANPSFYGKTFCTRCGDYFAVGEQGEFVWIEQDGSDGARVGT